MDTTSVKSNGSLAGIEAWAISQLKAHPKSSLALISTVWGGAIVLHHFARIGHLPILALPDLAGVVLASAVIGFAALLAVMVLLVAPGLMLLYWYRQGVRAKSIFCCGAARRRPTVMAGIGLSVLAALVVAVAYAATLAMPVFLLLPVFALAYCWYYRLWPRQLRCFISRATRRRTNPISYFLLSALAALLAAAAYAAMLLHFHWLATWLIASALLPMAVAIGLETPLRERVIGWLRPQPVFVVFQFVCYLIAWAIMTPMLLLWRYEPDHVVIRNVAIMTAMTLLLHLVIFATEKMPIRHRLIAPTAVIVYLMIFTNVPSIGASRVIAFFGLGEVPKINLILTKQGCDTVNTAWARRPCVVTGHHSGAYLLADVDLLTRIGPHYVLAQRDSSIRTVDPQAPRVAVRGDDVLGWSRTE